MKDDLYANPVHDRIYLIENGMVYFDTKNSAGYVINGQGISPRTEHAVEINFDKNKTFPTYRYCYSIEYCLNFVNELLTDLKCKHGVFRFFHNTFWLSLKRRKLFISSYNFYLSTFDSTDQ